MLIHGPGPGQLITAPLGSQESGFSAQITVKKWFTTIRDVMSMYFGATGGSDIRNEEVILLGNAAARLNFSNIKADSEQVKRIQVQVPPDMITFFSANSWVNLSNDDIVRGSIQVFDEGEDERLLIEGIDFEIDYKAGRIRRLQSGGEPGSASGAGAGSGSGIAQFASILTVQQSVIIHYSFYTAYAKDVDYHINYHRGLISRVNGGAIQVGEKVFIDYQTGTNIDNVIVEKSIDQAHTFIMQRISQSLEGNVSVGLRFAETYFALAYLALAGSSDMLEGRRNDEVDNAAGMMIQVAHEYEEKGWGFLSQFLTITSPRRRGGKRQKNLSWRNW